MHPLSRLQGGLEELYRVATGVQVTDFVVDDDARDQLGPARRPREQLLVCEDDGELSVGLYVDPEVVAALHATLGGQHPRGGLSAANFSPFLLALEGVSHFVYTVLCARDARAVTALELELQAEVDKYVTCVLTLGAGASADLRRRLFVDVDYEDDLDGDERDRYRAANDNAHRYATYLEEAFVAPGRVGAMLPELRRFYRHPLARKLEVIAKAA
ncbi:MAG: hypothetical protein KA297_18440 [Kofleriaceae bacterium]|nr:hypothetical protein [Kofleriaceae bacterium]